MKYLIVNADDFGASNGINRGIIEAHRHGIVTSASLMVNTPWSREAAILAMSVRHLSVGLHVDLAPVPASNDDSSDRLRAALDQQLAKFKQLTGQLPTHLDSHHNVHRDPRFLQLFEAFAAQYRLPLRWQSPLHYCPRFYGQWNDESHLEQIGSQSLIHILRTQVEPGITELSCHPGYVDVNFSTGYQHERMTELFTLCDPSIRRVLEALSIQLVNYYEITQLSERDAA